MSGNGDLERRLIRLEMLLSRLPAALAKAERTAARALQEATRDHGGGGGGTGGAAVRKVKVNGSGIAAATAASTPRAGVGEFCDLVSGVWTPNGEAAAPYNPSPGGAVGANAFVTVAFVEGVWEIVLEPC